MITVGNVLTIIYVIIAALSHIILLANDEAWDAESHLIVFLVCWGWPVIWPLSYISYSVEEHDIVRRVKWALTKDTTKAYRAIRKLGDDK